MDARRIRNGRAFGIESLAIRNAPSHIGGMAHLAAAVHAHHAAVHVRHDSDSTARDRVNSVDRSSGIERSHDVSVESSSDPSSVDTNSRDRSVVDSSSHA